MTNKQTGMHQETWLICGMARVPCAYHTSLTHTRVHDDMPPARLELRVSRATSHTHRFPWLVAVYASVAPSSRLAQTLVRWTTSLQAPQPHTCAQPA